MSGQADHWSEYWRQDGAGGEVFVGTDGKGNAEIGAFWASLFEDLETGSRVIDIACGAGSIFRHARETGACQLVAADLSIDALTLLRERTDGVEPVAASASALPFPPGCFDLVVSQFGVEYAGQAAFEEAFHLLRPGGRIVTLTHIRDGAIDRKNAALEAGVRKAEELDFIALALQLTRAAFSGVGAEEAVRRFQPAERAMAAFIMEHPGGLHEHLYAGFRQLFERRARYDESDILGWLNGMASEIELNRLRFHEMRRAALGDKAIEQVRCAAERCGVTLDISQLILAGHAIPVAWRIEGTRG